MPQPVPSGLENNHFDYTSKNPSVRVFMQTVSYLSSSGEVIGAEDGVLHPHWLDWPVLHRFSRCYPSRSQGENTRDRKQASNEMK